MNSPHPSATAIVDLYERHARSWDGDRGRALFERGWLDRFREVAGDGTAILDLGCGAGEPIASYLIGCGHAITGLDSSPTLIGIAAARFSAHTWIVDDMRRVALAKRFGGILAWDSFFHLAPDDQRTMFPIFRAHAADGAALMFTSGPHAGEAIGSYRGDTLYHASLDAAEYTALLHENGFEVVAHVADDAMCGGHTVWLARAA